MILQLQVPQEANEKYPHIMLEFLEHVGMKQKYKTQTKYQLKLLEILDMLG
jgi:hypothetical protein